MEFRKLKNIPQKFAAHLDFLMEGNKRFIDNSRRNRDFDSIRTELVAGQKPAITVLTCSDSRVDPAILFDATLGEVFVIRNAGNVVGHVSLGSIEYSSAHLNAPLFLVLGHNHCGGVTEAFHGATGSEFVNRIMDSIKPSIESAKEKNPGSEVTIDMVIEENVRQQMQKAYDNSEALQELLSDGKLAIVGAVYDLETGRVNFLDECIF